MRARSERMLDWRSGGWLLLLTGLVLLLVVAWFAVPLLRSPGAAVGNGIDVESYGFDLSSLTVPRARLAAAGFPKDGVPALVDPPTMAGSGVAQFNEERRGKYLVGDDRVVGVEIAGEARAYPIRVLNWHEIVNDTLGGRPIAVTYHPLCDSVVVFDRRVGDEILEWRVSGLLFDSNLLMYDRRTDPADESLWGQLAGRAVAGPAVGHEARPRVVPASLTRWADWLERHPATGVLEPEEQRLKRYARNPYGSYFVTGRPRFPVEPFPPPGPLRPMAPVMILPGQAGVEPCPLGTASSSPACESAARSGFRFVEGPEEVSVLADPGAPAVVYSAWFAWFARETVFGDEPAPPAQ